MKLAIGVICFFVAYSIVGTIDYKAVVAENERLKEQKARPEPRQAYVEPGQIRCRSEARPHHYATQADDGKWKVKCGRWEI